jgi:hypothetical protein
MTRLYMLIINMIHGKDIKVLFLQKNRLINKINKQMMLLIFAKEGWSKDVLNKNRIK